MKIGLFLAVLVQINEAVKTQRGIGRGCEESNNDYNFCKYKRFTIDERVADLIIRLSLEEKIGLLGASDDFAPCPMMDRGVSRLGIGRYTNYAEVNTGVASRCLDSPLYKCSTTFASPALLAASFNRTLWNLKGQVISSEMRSLYHTNSHRGNGAQSSIGLHGYGPNINLVCDPRWGRNQEVPSEDPYLAGEYSVQMVRGMQQRDAKGYLKMHVTLKHAIAYGVETHRQSFDANISQFDLMDTYLVAFEKAVSEGGALGLLCSYASVNGVPSCANEWLFKKARQEWSSPNLIVATDCGAIRNMITPGGNYYAYNDTLKAVSDSLNAGVDLELGDTYFQNNLTAAIDASLLNENVINQALQRVLYHRFQLGMFDPLYEQEYYWRPNHVETINSTKHQQINAEAAIQGLVLLKNPHKLLPLELGQTLAVVGPHAYSKAELFEWYHGDYVCHNNTYDCVDSIGVQLAQSNGQSATTIVPCGNVTQGVSDLDIQRAVQAARQSHTTVVLVGLDSSIERERVDRKNDIRLPESQRLLIQELQKVTSRLVMILIHGGAIAIDDLVDTKIAIVDAFYPATFGARALAKTLFGHSNKWGLLPHSIYGQNYTAEHEMNDMGISKHPGRTYRYYKGNNTLFEFGHGLSYTEFSLENCCITRFSRDISSVSCRVSNIGNYVGDAIILLFHRLIAPYDLPHPVPRKQLIDFQRHSLLPGAHTRLTFKVNSNQILLTTNNGTKVFYRQFKHELTLKTHNSVSWSGTLPPYLHTETYGALE